MNQAYQEAQQILTPVTEVVGRNKAIAVTIVAGLALYAIGYSMGRNKAVDVAQSFSKISVVVNSNKK